MMPTNTIHGSNTIVFLSPAEYSIARSRFMPACPLALNGHSFNLRHFLSISLLLEGRPVLLVSSVSFLQMQNALATKNATHFWYLPLFSYVSSCLLRPLRGRRPPGRGPARRPRSKQVLLHRGRQRLRQGSELEVGPLLARSNARRRPQTRPRYLWICCERNGKGGRIRTRIGPSPADGSGGAATERCLLRRGGRRVRQGRSVREGGGFAGRDERGWSGAW